MGVKEDAAQAARERNAALILAAGKALEQTSAVVAGACEALAPAIGAAFLTAAQQMRERGQALIDARRKGAKGTNESLVFAAGELESIAAGLKDWTPEQVLARAASEVAAVGADLGATLCGPCQTGGHECKGCGTSVPHGTYTCPQCVAEANPLEAVATGPDGTGVSWGALEPVAVAEVPESSVTVVDVDAGAPERYDGQCPELEPDPPTSRERDACMLPATHKGMHIGRKTRWPSTAPVEIPQQAGPAPAEVISADIAKEATAIVEQFINPEPAKAPVAVGGPVYAPAAHLYPDIVTGPTAVMNDASPLASVGPEALRIVVGTPDGHEVANAVLSITTVAPGPVLLDFANVPGSPKAYQSPSSIKTYVDCGYKYAAQYRHGIAEVPAWWNVGGTAFHLTVQRIEDGTVKLPDDPMEAERVASEAWGVAFGQTIASTEAETGVASQSWRAANKGAEGYAWWTANGDDMVRRYVAQRAAWLKDWTLIADPAGKLVQEYEFNATVEDQPFKIIIDSVWIKRDGSEVRIVDYKSGSRDEDDIVQLQTYGEVLLAVGAVAPGVKLTGAYYRARKGDYRVYALGGNAALVAARARATAAGDAAGIFLPRPSSFCGGCFVQNRCPVAQAKRSVTA